MCSYEPRRLPSLQYTILVLSGCSSSPTSRHPLRERGQHLVGLASLTQCTTASST